MKTAIIIGASGLTGSHLLRILLEDNRFGKVIVFVRRGLEIHHPKLDIHIVDFEKIENWGPLIQGDALFSCLGTTLKKAGSKEEQYKVDYAYQYNVAATAAKNGVPVFVLMSSMMASPKSNAFYTRMKGELEQDICLLDFPHVHILRPGILDGPRKESRRGEKAGIVIARLLAHVPGLHKYRPVHVQTVAQAMVNVSFDISEKLKIYELEGVFDRAKNG
jgi:uncharacterized protein YbjT (DUF2867 family)